MSPPATLRPGASGRCCLGPCRFDRITAIVLIGMIMALPLLLAACEMGTLGTGPSRGVQLRPTDVEERERAERQREQAEKAKEQAEKELVGLARQVIELRGKEQAERDRERAEKQREEDRALWALGISIISALIAAISVAFAILTQKHSARFNELLLRRQARYDFTRLEVEIDRILIDRPKLWAVYEKYRDLAEDSSEESRRREVTEDSSEELGLMRREALIYLYFNLFATVFDYYSNVRQATRPDEKETFVPRLWTSKKKSDWDQYERKLGNHGTGISGSSLRGVARPETCLRGPILGRCMTKTLSRILKRYETR